MRCEFYKELIFKKLDNEINDEEEKVLLEHLQSCGECQTDFKQLSDIEDILNNQQMVEVPKSFSKAVVDKIKQPAKKRFFIRPVFTVAAACILLVLAYYSHAFDNLLSSGNIVQKNNAGNASTSLQEGINRKLNDNDKEKMSSYVQQPQDKSTADNKKSDSINQNKPADTNQANNSQTQIQKQPDNTGSPLVLKSAERAELAGGTASQESGDTQQVQDNLGTQESQDNYGEQQSDDTQIEPSAKMFGASSTAASGDQSTYKVVATVMAEKQEILDILKKYTVTQKSEFEFELLKSEFDKIYSVLESKNIKVEIKEININSDIVLLVITK